MNLPRHGGGRNLSRNKSRNYVGVLYKTQASSTRPVSDTSNNMITPKKDYGEGRKTMTAAMVTKFNSPVELLHDVPVPEPGPNQILVRVTASSLCMSDLAGIKGALGSTLPYCGGHEPVGFVDQLGLGVVGFKVGDRVGFMPASRTCQDCTECYSGNHRFCTKRTAVGFSGPYGGFSEYCIADPLSTVKIPDALDDHEAAPLLCAGVTAYAAIKKVSARQHGGSLINIVGCGGVGHLAIQYAKAMGFRVTAYDITEDKLKLAKDCGADKAILSTEMPPSELERAPSTVVISGAVAAYTLAMEITESHGAVIAVGVPFKPIECNVLTMVHRELSIIAVNQGNKQDLQKSLELAALKGIKPIIEKRSIVDINDGIKQLTDGSVAGRLVYSFP